MRSSLDRRAKILDTKSLLVSAVAVLGVAGPDLVAAQAADEPAEDDRVTLSEVIVTAQRVEQRAIDVGISLNVFDQETLEARRLSAIEDLAQATPGLDVFEGNGTNNPTITLRGVGTTNPFLNNNPSVAIYADQVYLPFSSFLTLPFFDVERIEVLKGPQVALYGRNATAGAMNVISARPTRELSGYVDLSYGRFGMVEARGAISGPLGERAQLRLAAIRQDGGGYIHRAGTVGSTAGFSRTPAIPGVESVPAVDEYGDKDLYAFRASLAWQPTDQVDVAVIAHYGRDDSELIGSTNINGDRVGVFQPPSDAPFVDYDNVAPATDTEQYGLALQADWHVGDLTLTSLTGYNRIDRQYAIGDFVPVRVAEASFDEGVRSFSQELRLARTATDGVRWIFGASYNDDEVDYDRVLLSYDFLLGALGTTFVEKSRAWAVYGDGEIELRPGWFLGAGLRYTDEDKEFDGGTFDIDPFGLSRIVVAFPGLGPDRQLFGSPTYDESDLSGEVSLNWKPSDDLLVYGSINRGFKSGGFDGSGVTVPSGFEPYGSEKVWAYELGMKSSAIDGLDFSMAAFFYDYTDKQVLALLDIGGGVTEAVIQNAAAAEIKGVEAEIRWRPVRGLALSLNGTVLDSEITEFVSADPDETASRVGNDLPGTPDYQLTAGIDYTVPLMSNFTLDASLWAYNVAGAYRDVENTEELKSEDRFVVNARVTLARPAAGWSAYVYAENLFDDTYVTSVRSLVGMLGKYYGPPRSYGVGLKYQF